MKDAYKTKAQLIKELGELRLRVKQIEESQAERRHIESELRKSEESLKACLNATTDLAMLIDAEGKIVALNKQFADRLGKTAEDLLSRPVLDFMEPQFADRRREQLNSVIKTGQPVRFEDERAGRVVDHNFYPVCTPQGKVERVAIFARDVTDHKRAEEALRHSEALLKNILSASPVAISYVEKGRLRWSNQAMAQIFRYQYKAEYVGKPAKDFYSSDEEYNRVLEIFRTGLKDGTAAETEAEFRRHDGSVFPGHMKISPLDASNLGKGTISAIADITEQKRAEEALRQSREEFRRLYEESKRAEDLYRSLLSSSADAVIVYDIEGKAQYVNESFTQIFGWTLDDVRDRHSPHVPESRLDEIRIIIDNLIREGAPLRGVETKRVTKEGRVLDISASASRYHDHEGKPAGLLVILRDITESKRLEEQLRQAVKMEAVGRLAGGVAHDFNNLLTAIMGYTNLLLQQIPRDSSQHEKLAQVFRAADRAATLTGQLLAFSRKQVLDVKVLDLNHVIAGWEQVLQRMIGENVQLTMALSQSLGRVKADPGQIEQILMNLVVNARDAMPSGGKLTIETGNSVLSREYSQTHPEVEPGRYVMFSVSDGGQGMDENTLSRVFEPFFTTKEKGVGTGLGLSTVYGIVKQHRGHISVYSEPGRGTTFKVYLPLVEQSVEEPTVMGVTSLRPVGQETVLIVEDEEIVRELATEALDMLGYSVLAAGHPDEAKTICSKHGGTIDLLLTDVCLPDMDGKSLFDTLSPQRPSMKVLYVSGYTENFVVHRGILDSGVSFLPKPFTVEGLAQKVREVLDAN
ncbi:MAG: PAS domain S-box protein [Desulfomonile tiedjei]|nr:PAS domain S-box protein [Desulfomonile tiedjei]